MGAACSPDFFFGFDKTLKATVPGNAWNALEDRACAERAPEIYSKPCCRLRETGAGPKDPNPEHKGMLNQDGNIIGRSDPPRSTPRRRGTSRLTAATQWSSGVIAAVMRVANQEIMPRASSRSRTQAAQIPMEASSTEADPPQLRKR
jgi:hypothetical protein